MSEPAPIMGALPKPKIPISLVLGSGGARGYAHIGVVEELIAQGFEIRSIAGSSMGALVGGIHAAGKLDAFRDWVLPMARYDVFKLLDITITGGGFIKGNRIINAMREQVGDVNIEDLPISYTAVAVDLDAHREVWFSRGSLFDAIRASIAIPTIFRPHRYQGRLLVDGGLLNPLPVSPTLRDHTVATIAVDVNATPEPLDGSPAWPLRSSADEAPGGVPEADPGREAESGQAIHLLAPWRPCGAVKSRSRKCASRTSWNCCRARSTPFRKPSPDSSWPPSHRTCWSPSRATSARSMISIVRKA
jgi:NTE family protein